MYRVGGPGVVRRRRVILEPSLVREAAVERWFVLLEKGHRITSQRGGRQRRLRVRATEPQGRLWGTGVADWVPQLNWSGELKKFNSFPLHFLPFVPHPTHSLSPYLPI